MTFDLLQHIIVKNNIPMDVKLMSDSGWECNATDMNAIYYNEEKNLIIFTQTTDELNDYNDSDDWMCIYEKE